MASGAPRASGTRYSSHAEERVRSSADAAFNPEPQQQHPGMQHKRSASGNPRLVSRSITTGERRYEERRVTERTFEAHVDKILRRTSSPEKQRRRSGTGGEKRDGDVRRQKSVEFRPRDSVSDPAQ
ncbi:hypothetical protein E4U54_008834, partial [Claviceps lovelessii]